MKGGRLSLDWLINACPKAGPICRVQTARETQKVEEEACAMWAVDRCSGSIPTEQPQAKHPGGKLIECILKTITQETALLTEREQLSHPVNALVALAVASGLETDFGKSGRQQTNLAELI